MFRFKIFTLSLLLFCAFSLHSQKDDNLCYGKAMIPDVIQKVKKSFPIYTGKDFGADYLKWEQIIVQPEKLVWEERKNNNCVSKDPKECMMVCSMLIPAQIKNYQVVTDLNATKDIEWVEFEYENIVKEGGEEYVTVVCMDKVDALFIAQLSEQLNKKGYFDGEIHEIFSQRLKNSLIKYQKESGLPEGALDLKTLASLGFGYTSNE